VAKRGREGIVTPRLRPLKSDESASQFNREYSRLFGQPLIRDIKALRADISATGLL